MYLPDVNELAADIHDFVTELNSIGESDGDVRLRLFDGAYEILTGDAQYDTDHRGAWGSGSISASATMEDCVSLANDLINEAQDDNFERDAHSARNV